MQFKYEKTMLGPYPAKRRFISSVFVGGEACYREEELRLREMILSHRKEFLDESYRLTQDSWFNEDFASAFVQTNRDAWFGRDSFKPRHHLSHDEFYFHDLDGLDVRWESAEVLMKRIGDYLHIRNKDLGDEYLNQPMNYFLRDLAHILKKMAVDTNEQRVSTNLIHLLNYVRHIERSVDAAIGSDRLFLAFLREGIDTEFLANVNQAIESTRLKKTLHQLHGEVVNYANNANRIVHFSLSSVEVNPHAYINHVGQGKDTQFPAHALQHCLKSHESSFIDDEAVLIKIVDECRALCLVEGLPNAVKVAYAKSVQGLNALLDYKVSLASLMQVLDDSGEVAAVGELNTKIKGLLESLVAVVDDSKQSIKIIEQANKHQYFEAISQQQAMSFFSRLVSSLDEVEQLISNQDLLDNFESSPLEINTKVARIEATVDKLMRNLADLSHEPQRSKWLDETQNFKKKTVQGIDELISPEVFLPPLMCDIEEAHSSAARLTPPLHGLTQSLSSWGHMVSQSMANPVDVHPKAIGQGALVPTPYQAQSKSTQSWIGVSAGLMLGAVALKIGYDAYQSFTNKDMKPASIDECAWRQCLDVCSDNLARVYGLAAHLKDDFVHEQADLFKEDLDRLEREKSSLEALQDLAADIMYYHQHYPKPDELSDGNVAPAGFLL